MTCSGGTRWKYVLFICLAVLICLALHLVVRARYDPSEAVFAPETSHSSSNHGPGDVLTVNVMRVGDDGTTMWSIGPAGTRCSDVVVLRSELEVYHEQYGIDTVALGWQDGSQPAVLEQTRDLLLAVGFSNVITLAERRKR